MQSTPVSPHHAATPILARPQVWVFLHPPHTTGAPVVPDRHGACWLLMVTSASNWLSWLDTGASRGGGWMHRHGCVPRPNARQPQCTAR